MAVLVQRNLGFLLLAIFLVLYGLAGMLTLGLPPIVMAVLALLARDPYPARPLAIDPTQGRRDDQLPPLHLFSIV